MAKNGKTLCEYIDLVLIIMNIVAIGANIKGAKVNKLGNENINKGRMRIKNLLLKNALFCL